MARRKTARQIAASKRNLVKARNARRRRAIATVAGVAAVGAGLAVASKSGAVKKTTGANVSTVSGQRLKRGVSVSKRAVVVRTGKNKTTLSVQKPDRLNLRGKGAGSYKAPRGRTERKMNQFNRAMTESQKERSAMRFNPKGVNVKGRKIEQDEVIRRTNAYVSSLPKRKQTTKARRQATNYFSSQSRYDARGTSPSQGRRGRKRKYELRNRTR